MSNRVFFPTKKLERVICDEIREKNNDYESKMAYRLAHWTETAELLQGKTRTQLENARISPNSAELYKSVRAITNMQFRMLTGIRPFFQLSPLDILGHADAGKIIKNEHYVTNQLDLSNFYKGLYRALYQLNLYGSVAVHEQFEPLRSSFLGNKRFITSFRPVSLINCAFALDGYDVEESSWVCLNDIQAKSSLNKLISHDPNGKMYNIPTINSILNTEDYIPQVNAWVQQRMAWSGYVGNNFKGGMERSTYYGSLDCMSDGEEYAVEVGNRTSIIRMESYDGIRPIRIATINNLDVEPLGNGLGDQFRPLLGQIDETRAALLNTVTFAGANMFSKQKGLSDEDMEFAIRNFGIVALENPDIKPLGPSPMTIQALSGYQASLIQEYRQGSGATDTLQALVQGDSSTATEVSLAMNEAVRNISVGSEILAPTLVGGHIKVILQNGQKYNTKPFTLVVGGTPIVVTPNDLQIDLDVSVLTMTDQNFRPARLRNLLQAATIMNSTPPNTLNGTRLDSTPTVLEALKLLDVPNWEKSVKMISDQDLMRAQVINAMMGPQNQGSEIMGPGNPRGETRTMNEMPGATETRELNRAASGIDQTPSGPVLTAPGTQASTTQALRSASVQ